MDRQDQPVNRVDQAAPSKKVTPTPTVQKFIQDSGLASAKLQSEIVIFPTRDKDAWNGIVGQAMAHGYSVQATGGVTIFKLKNGPDVVVVPPATGWLVLVLDDFGFRLDRARRALDLNQPLVFSVLPGRPKSSAIARMVTLAGQTLFLHQPMEPEGFPEVKPGKYPLLRNQTELDHRRILMQNAAMLPGAIGLNNHMGSLFTESAAMVTTVVEFARHRDWVVLDSLTSGASKLYTECRQRYSRCLKRDVFLDNNRTAEQVDAQIEHWLRGAERRGFSMAIGHPYAITLERLENLLANDSQNLEKRGLKLVSYRSGIEWQNWKEKQKKAVTE